jgi:hypothetical protein
VIGQNNAAGEFQLLRNPTAWPGNATLPAQVCTRGSVGQLTAPAGALGARYLCAPCAANQVHTCWRHHHCEIDQANRRIQQ